MLLSVGTMSYMVKEISFEDLNMVSGGSMYSVDERVWGVQDFIEDCKTARANNLSSGTALDNNQTLDWLWSKYKSRGLEDRLTEWGYGDILERYYFENALFM